MLTVQDYSSSSIQGSPRPQYLQQSSLPLLNFKRLNERVGNLKAEMQQKSSANSILTSNRLLGRRIDYDNDNGND
jgi:hypothetical protein